MPVEIRELIIKAIISNQQSASSNIALKKTDFPRMHKTMINETNNAGLIILHPFLPALFDHIELTKNNVWLGKASQAQAVLIMEFLATGQTEPRGLNISLQKILCGLAPTEPISANSIISPGIQKTSEALLTEVIQQWGGLKKISIDGFRQTFLQRSGKLSDTTEGYLLQVEQQQTDILLNSLPWNISVIKLPWMTQLLQAEWNAQ